MAELISIAGKAVKSVTKLGATHCDVLVTNTRTLSADIEKGSVKQASMANDPGVAIRAFRNGSSGFAYCTGHDAKSIDRAASLAASQAKAGTPDSDFKGLPEKATPAKVGGLFEPKVADLGSDDVVGMVMELAAIAGDDKRIYSSNASVNISVCEVALANSNGIEMTQKMSSHDMVAESVAKDGSDMFSGFDFYSSRRFNADALREVGESAREHAIKGLSQTKIETGDYPVVMDPLALGFLLANAVGAGVNADSVQRKRSYLAGKLGKKIGASLFSVTDDPTIAWAVGSTAFDGEGTPARKKAVIDKGKLSSYLYDSYTAGKDSVRSTGNASRGGSAWSYRSPPSISTSNLVVHEGRSTFDQMVRETKNGVYLRATFDHPNLATGEFSGLMMESYMIDDGEIGPSIRQATIGVGLVDMFNSVDMVGKGHKDCFGVRTPAIRISKARIGGSA